MPYLLTEHIIISVTLISKLLVNSDN